MSTQRSNAHAAHAPTGRGLTRSAISATLHCLTGCAIGEVLGMALATWWGWGNTALIVLSIALAFLFGYSPGDAARAGHRGGPAVRSVWPWPPTPSRSR